VSHEGITLISREALVAVLIMVTALLRMLVGRSGRRGLYTRIGTEGGMLRPGGALSATALARGGPGPAA
jgi:hypothetical protein